MAKFDAYGTQLKIGTAQVETAVVVVTTVTAGDANFTLTASGMTGSPITTVVALANGDADTTVARKAAAAMNLDGDITALFSVVAEGPNIVITDWTMPEMDGVELCRAVRSHEGITFAYVIIVTARHSAEDSLVEAFEAGADDYLCKPFSTRELLTRLTAQGLAPGVAVHLLQRSPTYVIEVGETTLALERRVAEAIVLREPDGRPRG